MTLDAGIEELYRIAVEERSTTSTHRLARLAEYCKQELARRGLHGAETEQPVPGIGRDKQWDVVWSHQGKCRLAISLKSILKNIPGTVPNRIDDLIGEVANAQLASPEIVIGYIVVFDVSEDKPSTRHSGRKWSEVLEERLRNLSGRRAPVWSFGMLEAFLIVRVDFKSGPCLITSEDEVEGFFRNLVDEVQRRNPSVR